MELIEIVKKLIGETRPTGDSSIDNIRYNNLVELCDLTEKLIFEINEISQLKNDERYSMQRSGKYADEFLKNINQ